MCVCKKKKKTDHKHSPYTQVYAVRILTVQKIYLTVEFWEETHFDSKIIKVSVNKKSCD